VRAWIALFALFAACDSGGGGFLLDGIWYGDDGRTIVIQDGQLRLASGEILASIEQLDDDLLRYIEIGGTDGPNATRVLQVEHQTPLRMTWVGLDGVHFRVFTRVADVE
jgi:hypothetical protein